MALLNCLPEPRHPLTPRFSCPVTEDMGAVVPDTCEELKRGLGERMVPAPSHR